VVLEVTATNDQGEKIFETSRIYMPQSSNSLDSTMVYGPTEKLGILRDTSIQPFAAKEEYFEIKLTETIQKATIEVRLSYQLRPGDVYPIHRMIREVTVNIRP
jgi:hypothetical protein